MAKLTIGEREFNIAPFKLGQLRRVAKHIDAINSRAGTLSIEATMAGVLESTEDIVLVLASGTVRIDSACDADWIDENVGFGDLPALSRAFTEVMREAGLAPSAGEAPGEAQAPAATPEAAGASQSV